ncbi:hypothetical protein, partial [Nocardioides sp.]|uniref:hypothetical protein n=1 Tax=Nocardioides sp. TaxID=35761 RepID=UPI002C2EC794
LDVDFVGDAADALAGSPVYVDPDASLSSRGDIASLAEEQDVAVVVLPELATGTFSASSLAGQVLRKVDSYDAVIVVVDGSFDSYGVAARESDEGAALTRGLNSAGHADGGAAVLETLSSDDWRTSTSAGGGGDDDSGSGLGTVVGVGSGVVAVAVVAVFGALVARRLKAGGSAPARDVPEELRSVLARLEALQRQHGMRLSPGVNARLQSILTNVGQLFHRIRRTGTEQQVRIASIEYVDVLTKLERALGEDYYLDILRNPRLWENAEARQQEVEEAVRATDDQLVANIRQVNASQDLEFKVALESLVGSMDATVKDIYSPTSDRKPDSPTDSPEDQTP